MTQRTPLVSVVIPACNAAHCLEACVQSVLAQTYPHWEVVIVDDGSTDDTAGAARRFTSDRIRYQRQENQGQGAARNAGLAVARGEYAAFLDADDEWKPEFLQRTVAFLDAHAQAVAVSTGFILRYADGQETMHPDAPQCRAVPAAGAMLEDFWAFWAEHDHVRTGTALMRKAVMDRAGYQRADLRVSQDLEYWGYLATFGPWGFIPEPLWVGNSRMAAARAGWMGKYAQRRRLCPTVESWESRILPRLAARDREAFIAVRGRVAAGFTHHMIIGGRAADALHTVRSYGAEMPPSIPVRLLRLAAAGGAGAWWLMCRMVALRERLKAARLVLRASP